MKKLLIRSAVVAVAVACFAYVAPAPRTRAAGITYTVAGITYGPIPATYTVCQNCVQSPSGWRGAPQQIGEVERITRPRGNTVYIVRARGIMGASVASVDQGTAQILATDEWRTRDTTYDQASDTILTAAGRRKGTPTEGVIAIVAPTVTQQGAGGAGASTITAQIHVPGHGLWSVRVTDATWKAQTATIRYSDPLRTPVEVSADPVEDGANGSGVKWGASVATEGPDVTAESTLTNEPWVVEVGGYLADMSTGGLLGYQDYRLGTDPGTVLLPLLTGRTWTTRLTVTYGSGSAALENSRSSFVYTPVPGVTIVNPPPTPRIIRSAILIVPGDIRRVPGGRAAVPGMED